MPLPISLPLCAVLWLAALTMPAPFTRAAEPAAASASAEEGPIKRFPEKPPAFKGKAVTVRLALSGMTCGGCAETIARLLTTIDGVAWAEVDLKNNRGEVQYDDARVTPERLLAKIKANGYGAKVSPGS